MNDRHARILVLIKNSIPLGPRHKNAGSQASAEPGEWERPAHARRKDQRNSARTDVPEVARLPPRLQLNGCCLHLTKQISDERLKLEILAKYHYIRCTLAAEAEQSAETIAVQLTFFRGRTHG